ncbi:MAG: SDR family oxidoreductase [Acidimicrobiaceae bacterium]|nr:SDR family oxidoreductase [Acidimicrobiaceae bacterium]
MAIVTGAGTVGPGVGVGKATSVVLAQQGARLVLMDVDADRAHETEALVKAEGVECLVCLGSVADPKDCEAAVSNAIDVFGTVDILVNNAATSIPGTVVSLSDADWDDVVSVNLMGAVRMSRFTVPVMQAAGRGAIVNISSIASSRHYVHAAYASAKAGLEALTRDMAVAHGRDGVRVNAIQPGHINTPRVVALGEAAKRQQDQALRTAASPLGTEGTAWDVAWAVEYLVSDRARWVTGVTLPVDGGVLCTSYMSMEPIIRRERG